MAQEKLPTDLYADPAMQAQYRIAGMLYLHIPRQARVIEDPQGSAALWLGQKATGVGDTVPLIACFEGSKGYWYGNVPSGEANPRDGSDTNPAVFGAHLLHYAEFETESAKAAIAVLAGEHVLEAAEERYTHLRTIMYARLLRTRGKPNAKKL